MKRIILLVLVACMLFSVNTLADSVNDEKAMTFYYEDREVIVESNGLTQEEMKRIADFIATDDNGYSNHSGVETYGLACLFGHSLTTTYATEITHNAYTTSPKCLSNYYKVETCTRSSCDYVKKSLVSSTRTAKCHG